MERLLIRNFKCFKEESVELNDLTLLVGANGYGKSSVIQSLLLMRSTFEQPTQSRIALNGKYALALGTSSAVLNQNASGSELDFCIENVSTGKTLLEYVFDIDTTDDKLWITLKSNKNGADKKSALTNRAFYYLNAERLGPRITQPIVQMEYLSTGVNGEFTAQVIDWESGRFKVDDKKWCPDKNTEEQMESSARSIYKNPFLPIQVNLWLEEVLPGVKVTARTDTKTLSSTILIENSMTKSNPVLATNIGFGISYVLPIIVSGLVAEEGSYLIVENPEAHLHPAAQSKIGQFLGMVARSGVKVVVETHSDHVLNGIQIYVAENPEYADKVTINYFTVVEDSDEPNIQAISIKSNGELSHWPKGFFDQSQLDYISLSKIRKNV